MKLKTKLLPYLVAAAGVSLIYPGGTVLIIETGDMIELASPVWLDARELDSVTRVETPRLINEMQVAEVESRSPVEELPPFDWYQPWSEPIFKRDQILYDSSVMPL